MIEKTVENLSEAEAALYDRQIRLWGLDAQKRLRTSRVLVAGVSGLGAEITKNLVLAGVKSLTLLDHRNVTELDTFANFLSPHDSIGKNIAEASKERAQVLNPMVDVLVDTEDILKKPDTYFQQFDIVCLCRVPREHLIRINAICHQHNVQFYAGDVFGMFGYMFCDLQNHKFVEEIKEKTTVKIGDEDKIVEETKMKPGVETFIPLSEALEVDWTSEKYIKRLARTSPSYFIMLCLLEFVDVNKRVPNPANKNEDEVELLTIKNALLNKIGVPQEKIPQQFASLVFGEVSPVCAIVGGVISQEMIKAVSQKDLPLNNFFFFSTLDGSGVVENIGC